MEKRDGAFVPDLLLFCKNDPERKLYVEIAVTHFLSEPKQASGERIIEIPVESEEDVERIRAGHLSEKEARFVGFAPQPAEVVDAECACCSRVFFALIVYESGKSILKQETLNELVAWRKRLGKKVTYARLYRAQACRGVRSDAGSCRFGVRRPVSGGAGEGVSRPQLFPVSLWRGELGQLLGSGGILQDHTAVGQLEPRRELQKFRRGRPAVFRTSTRSVDRLGWAGVMRQTPCPVCPARALSPTMPRRGRFFNLKETARNDPINSVMYRSAVAEAQPPATRGRRDDGGPAPHHRGAGVGEDAHARGAGDRADRGRGAARGDPRLDVHGEGRGRARHARVEPAGRGRACGRTSTRCTSGRCTRCASGCSTSSASGRG